VLSKNYIFFEFFRIHLFTPAALVRNFASSRLSIACLFITVLFAASIATSSQPALAALDAAVKTRLDANLRCHLGVYALPGQRSVTINGANGQPRGLHYTLSNGQFDKLRELSDGSWESESFAIRFEPCNVGTLRLISGEAVEIGRRVKLVEQFTTFTSDGIKFQGKLVLPQSGHAQALAIWIEGSNNNPTTDDAIWQYELTRRGVAVFVYDKRGTGASRGEQTSDFHLRARDTAAAIREARRLKPNIDRVGIIGASQGGWVAPIVAKLVPLSFVVAAFAMAEGPIAQDQAIVEQQLRDAGFDQRFQNDAKELVSITARIVRTKMLDADKGLAELTQFKEKHAGAPWLNAIEPRSYTGLFLKFDAAFIKTHGPALAKGLTFDFDPRPLIETIKPRQLWLLGGSDQQAPNARTQSILREIQQQRPNLSVVVFPNADHGLIETKRTASGVVQTFSAKLFDVTTDWILNKESSASTQFLIMPPTD
jgi:uncharacterized protein